MNSNIWAVCFYAA